MPFGAIYAMILFGLLAVWCGSRFALVATGAERWTVLGALLLAVALAGALLRRRGWARWAGFAASTLLAAYGLAGFAARSDVASCVVLLAAAVAAVLLLVPATGDPTRGATPSRGRWLELTAVAGAVLLASTAWWSDAASPRAVTAASDGSVPESAVARRVGWTDFTSGVARSRSERRPLLVTFVADWCPYCKKMDRSTWRDASVADRMRELVTVKVDAEDERPRGGVSGVDLARRFRVEGYPVQILLGADGDVISRADGYLSPAQLHAWLDRALRES